MKLTKFFAFALAALAFAACEPIGSGDNTPTKGAITLKADKTAVALGETVTFTVEQKGDDGTSHDVTSKATIYDKDLNTVDSKTFTPSQSGSYSFFATLGAENSNYVTVTVMASVPEVPADPQPENTKFNHRVVLIDHTGVNCGYCPYMTDTLLALAQTEVHNNYTEVTCHAGSYANGDPGNSAAANALNAFQSSMISGYPCLILNFYSQISNANGNTTVVKNAVLNAMKKDGADVGISLAVTGDSQTVYCAAQVKAAKSKEYKVTAWLLESGIYSPNQSNATKDVHKIYNFALRNIAGEYSRTNVQGESVGVLEAGQTTDIAFELPIISTKWNWENMDVLVIVSAKDGNNRWDVVNSAICHINETKEYEYIQ